MGRLVTVAVEREDAERCQPKMLVIRFIQGNAHLNPLLCLTLRHDPRLDEEILDLLPLIALQLNDLTKRRQFLVRIRIGFGVGFFRTDDVSVTSKLLLDGLEDLFGVIRLVQALDGRQCLATITLLDTNVDLLGTVAETGGGVVDR